MAQIGTRLFVQTFEPFNAVNLGGNVAEHRGLVATAGANFKHASQLAVGPLPQQLNHSGHHIGFGDGLAQTNGQAGVFIGLRDQSAFDKPMTLHRAHGLQHQRIFETLRSQFLHHVLPHGTGVQIQTLWF